MASLKKILGSNIQVLDDDPVQNVGSWSSGGAMNSGRSEFGGGGIQTSAMAAGGRSAGSPPGLVMNNVEIYNGSSWSETTEINTARRSHGAGGTANTAILIWGGLSQPSPPFSIGTNVESWNGSAWTEVAEVNSAKGPAYGSIGTYTSTIAVSGSPATATVESWNGSSWAETTDVNNARGNFGIWGTVTSALIGAGTQTAHVETWDGSSWTETTEVSNIREGGSASGDDSTSGIIFGGNYDPVGYLTKTESWNGSAWTEVNDLAIAKVNAGGGGSSTAGIGSGGVVPLSPNYGSATEEWNFPPPTATVRQEGQLYFKGGALKGFEKAGGIPAATWSSGGALNTGRLVGGGFGFTIPTAVCAGGYNPGGWKALTEEYNGSAFTEVNDMPTAIDDMGSGGSLTAGIIFGGEVPPSGSTTNKNFGYDGTNWTELTNLNTARRAIGGAGIQTSALAFGGQEPGGASAKTESWDGSSWTETGDLNTARMGIKGAGHSNTAAIGAGGGLDPVVNNVEQWDGSSWTEKNNLNTARSFFGGGGTSTAAIFYGGYVGTPSYTGKTESWNGTSMTEVNDMSTGRGSCGDQPAGGAIAQVAGGGSGSPSTTEEFTADITNTTITSS